jgi:Mce-associated membrane protein
VETESEEPAQPDPGPRSTRSRIVRSPILPWSLFVLALVVALLFALLWQGARSSGHRRAEVATAANRFLVALSNFQGSTIDADVREIRSFAVGDFADQVNTFFDRDAMDALRNAQAKSLGRVQNVFVESLSGGSATVFGVVNEQVTNAANPTPRTDVLRIEIEMLDTKAGWKVNRVNILQSPTGTPGPLGTTP